MKIETLLNLATTVFRQKFRENCPELSLPDLIPAAFDHLVQTFKVAFSSCCTEALKAYVESCDEKADTLTTPGGAVRFKMVCKKEFLTLNWKCFWKSARCSRLPARPSCMPMRASGQGWFRKWKERLLTERGAMEKVLRAMGYRLKSNQLKGKRRKDLLAARRFFRNNVHRMKYSWFHERGLPVGSGVVEAACKSVVKARMCRSGTRWTHGGGQTILSLRSLIKSNRWEACWSECQAIRLAA